MAKRISKKDLGIDDDLLSSLNKQLVEITGTTKKFEETQKALNQANLILSKGATEYAKTLKDLNVTTAQGQKEFSEKSKEANKLINDAQKLEQQQLRTKKLLEQSKQAELRTQKMINQEKGKTLTAYQKESKALNDNRNKWKELAVQNKQNTREGRELLKVIQQQDANLKKIDSTVGQNQRNVGNYTKAVSGLKNGLAQLGLAFGGFQLLKGAGQTVIEFDSAIADLSAITGATGKDLDFFKKNAIELGVNVKGGASAVVEAYKLIGSAKPELLSNASALNEVTEATILLAKASGMELPDAATALTDAMNQFGVGADEAGKFVDVLASGAKFGSAEIPQITEALLKFGAVAKTTNVSIQESTGLIENLAERGLKGAEAGTALRNVMLKLSAPDALPKEAQDRLKALGVNFDDLKDKSKPFSERLEALKPLLNDNAALIKVFGTENAVAATTLLSTTDRIKELTSQVDSNGVALEQANARSKTISDAFNRLKETFNGMILSFANGSDAGGKFVGVLDFMSRNLSTIVSVVKTVGTLFLVYKARLIAINVAQKLFSNGTGGMNIGLKSLVTNLKEGAKAGTGMGGALKGIGWSSLIALASAFVTEIYEVVSGMRLAEFRVKEFQKAMEKGTKFAGENVKRLRVELQKQINDINLSTKSETEKAKAIKEANEEYMRDIQARLKLTRQFHTEADKERKEAIKARDAFGTAYTPSQFKELQMLEAAVTGTTQKQKELFAAIQEFNGELGTQEQAVVDLTVAELGNNNVKEKAVKLQKERNKGLEIEIGLYDEFEGRDLEESNALELARIEAQRLLNVAEYFRITKEIELSKAKEKGDAKEILRIEQELKQARIDEINARVGVELSGSDNYEEQLKIQKQGELDIQNLNEKAVENEKKNALETQKYIEITTDFLEKQIDKRIELLNKEIEARQNFQSTLEELANNGNIQAQQSLAENAELQRQAEAEKVKQERRKQQLQIVASFLTSYNQHLESGDEAGEAFAKALTEKATLEALLASIPAFLEGTEDTGRVNNPLDANGGRLAVLHDNERVLTKEQNKAIGGLSNEDVVSMVQKAKIVDQMGDYSNTGWKDAVLVSELNGLRTDMKAVKKAIEDKPETNYNVEGIVNGVMHLTKVKKEGSNITFNRFKIS